ncbi:MAG: hypothetical protein MK132_27660, partial [Lentisphaerales bacterium]|nr:hypothetical protein [Lentisphaerales bacterium]
KSVMDWAEKVIKNHPDHRVFITVHEYMTEESRLLSKDGRPDPKGKDVVGVFERLAKLNPNVEFITCGHVKAVKKSDGKIIDDADIATGHRSDEMEDGVTVHQMLFNAQWLKNDKGQANGGDGWLLLLEFSADNKLVKVKTYSPYLDLWRTGSEYEYNLQRSTIKK